MDNRRSDISTLIHQALHEQERLIEYSKYPPIYNSNLMLREMLNYVNEKLEPSDTEINELNVGLLAAKSLDFVNRFNKYAMLLHNAWSGFLSFLNKSRAIPLLGPQREAYNFYLKHQFNHNQIMDYLDGIDFSKQINTNWRLKQNETVSQWKIISMPQGNYYADKGKSPDCLGIYCMQEDYIGNVSKRFAHCFILQTDVIVLKSTAAAVLDTWSVKGPPFQKTQGGCIQYFNANDKAQFKQIFP